MNVFKEFRSFHSKWLANDIDMSMTAPKSPNKCEVVGIATQFGRIQNPLMSGPVCWMNVETYSGLPEIDRIEVTKEFYDSHKPGDKIKITIEAIE